MKNKRTVSDDAKTVISAILVDLETQKKQKELEVAQEERNPNTRICDLYGDKGIRMGLIRAYTTVIRCCQNVLGMSEAEIFKLGGKE